MDIKMNQDNMKLASVLLENLKEMNKAYQAAHESVLGFSWKKLWPFNQFLPQVDFLRVMRILEQVREATRQQHQFIAKEKAGANPADQDFIKTVPPYLDAIAECCTQLVRIAQYKQDKLEKRDVGGVLVFNRLLKDYEETISRMRNAGLVSMNAWNDRPS